ncbi:hypothetical protein [Thalassoglobus sp.]|uniref:hypothetical protein n=1 Tax=Thalassoglobus sp. TaxID=2795869 RepID=UPI003AA93826
MRVSYGAVSIFSAGMVASSGRLIDNQDAFLHLPPLGHIPMTYRLKPNSEDKSAPASSQKDEKRKKEEPAKTEKALGRLVSLDAFRGFIMVMLAANGFGLYKLSTTDESSELWNILNRETFEQIAFHFEHPPWQSCFVPGSTDATVGNAWLKWKVSFWDLIQPAFMFMVGMAMPFSYARRESSGQSALTRTIHAFLRAVVLVLLAVFLYSQGNDSTNWMFTNVLGQIGLGYFFVYLMLGFPRWAQISAFVVILIGTTLAGQFVPLSQEFVPEEVNASYERGEIFAEPYRQWSKNWNVFHEFDLWFLNQFPRPERDNPEEIPHRFNRGGYTTLNFVPSMATMLLGVFLGQFVLIAPRNGKTFLWLLLAALLCTGLGVAAGATCNPIVKRIWTPAWVLFSGGYVIGLYALFYLLFDLWPLKKLAFPLVIVGMNSIFVYMVGQLLRSWISREIVKKHFSFVIDKFFVLVQSVTGSEYSPEQLQEMFAPVTVATSVFLVIWLFCLWLYRQRIFIRI